MHDHLFTIVALCHAMEPYQLLAAAAVHMEAERLAAAPPADAPDEQGAPPSDFPPFPPPKTSSEPP